MNEPVVAMDARSLVRPGLKGSALVLLLAMPFLVAPAKLNATAPDKPWFEHAALPDEATRARRYPVFAAAETRNSEPARVAAGRNRARPRSTTPGRFADLKSVWRANPGRPIQIN
jgi:hypothetical protein